MDVPEIYKLRRTIDTIERLQGGGERSIRIEELAVLVDLLTEGHVFFSHILNEGFIALRGRHIRDTPYSQVVQMGARDPLTVTDYGRCHTPKNAVLYASINLETVLSELGTDVGAKIQVITIRKKPGQEIKYTSVGNMDHVRRHGRALLGGDDEVKTINDYWQTLSELERLRHNLADAFFADKFRQPSRYAHEYKVTSLFSKMIFSQGVDAFFYPSIGHLGGWNIAITPEAFERGFEIVSCEVIEVVDTLGYGIFSSKPVWEHSEIRAGQFVWTRPTEVMALGSFDEYVWHHLSYPGRHTLLFQVMKITNDEFSQEQIDASFGNNAPKDTFNFAMKRTRHGSFELRYDRDLAYVVNSLGEGEQWDFIVCTVVPTTDAEAMEIEQNEFVRNVSNGAKSYDLFTKSGIWVTPPIATGPLQKDFASSDVTATSPNGSLLP